MKTYSTQAIQRHKRKPKRKDKKILLISLCLYPYGNVILWQFQVKAGIKEKGYVTVFVRFCSCLCSAAASLLS